MKRQVLNDAAKLRLSEEMTHNSASLKADSIKWCMSLGRVTFSLGLVTLSLERVTLSLERVTPASRFVTYRSSSGKFTVRRAVSDKSAGKSEEA